MNASGALGDVVRWNVCENETANESVFDDDAKYGESWSVLLEL